METNDWENSKRPEPTAADYFELQQQYDQLQSELFNTRQQNASLFGQLETAKKQVNDKQLEVDHCHAVCDELRQKLDQAQAQAFGAGCQNQIVAAVTAQRIQELSGLLQRWQSDPDAYPADETLIDNTSAALARAKAAS